MLNLLYEPPVQLERASGKPPQREGEVGHEAFRKDYARLLHAPSFRRLQNKTQLFPGTESDFFRNRLTHSLEVEQIARGIAARINKKEIAAHLPGCQIDEDLVGFAAIAHDLGHPPFGHNGEKALDELMLNYGGFEGNAQTLRILASVEAKLISMESDGRQRFISSCGLDLTYRTLASVLKYDKKIPQNRPKDASLVKGYYGTEAELVEKIKEKVGRAPGTRTFKTLECSIMDIADDIAYSTYDLEDSLHGGFVSPMMLFDAISDAENKVTAKVIEKTNAALAESGYESIGGVSDLLDVLIQVFRIEPEGAETREAQRASGQEDERRTALVKALRAWKTNDRYNGDSLYQNWFTAQRVGNLVESVELVPCVEAPQFSTVRMKRNELLQVEILKHLNYELVIRSPRLAVVEHRGKSLVIELFRALEENPDSLLPMVWQHKYREATDEGYRKRLICDYVASMTDRGAAELYARLFGDGASVFKPLS